MNRIKPTQGRWQRSMTKKTAGTKGAAHTDKPSRRHSGSSRAYAAGLFCHDTVGVHGGNGRATWSRARDQEPDVSSVSPEVLTALQEKVASAPRGGLSGHATGCNDLLIRRGETDVWRPWTSGSADPSFCQAVES
jgi:hypothetical protein